MKMTRLLAYTGPALLGLAAGFLAPTPAKADWCEAVYTCNYFEDTNTRELWVCYCCEGSDGTQYGCGCCSAVGCC